MSPKKKNLVLTLAYRYKWEHLRIFVTSLYESGFEGDLVIFCARMDQATIQRLEDHGVTAIKVSLPLFRLRNIFLLLGWAPYRLIIGLIPYWNAKRFIGKYVFNIMCARFAHFHTYLEKHRETYDKALIADVRDVCFQNDPFEGHLGGSIVSFFEDRRILDCKTNLSWIRQVYGDELGPEFLNKVITCAGVTIGKSDAVFEYLTLMLNELFVAKTITPVSGADQAVHNVIFHNQMIDGSTLQENGNVLCMTMGSGQPYQLNSSSEVTAGDQVISILHQYDRIPDLKKMFHTRFGNDR